MFSNSFLEVRRVLRRSLARIQGFGLNLDEIANIEIVLCEVLNNVVEHAYEKTPHGLIELRLQSEPDSVSCTVLDDGRPFPTSMLPLDRDFDAPAIRGYPEGGFGWFLIRELARDLEYSRLDDRNCLKFRIPVSPQLRSN